MPKFLQDVPAIAHKTQSENDRTETASAGRSTAKTTASQSANGRKMGRLRPLRQLVPKRVRPVTIESTIANPMTCEEAKMQTQLAYFFDAMHLRGSWLCHIPARTGCSEMVNAAAVATLKLQRCQPNGQSDVSTARSAAQCYNRAVRLVNASLQSPLSADSAEPIILAMGMMAMFQFSQPSGVADGVVHWIATGTILLSSPSLLESSLLARDLLIASWERTFLLPCVMGVPSPFEICPWPTFGTLAGGGETMSDIRRLEVAACMLHIRLPRLIMQVRHIRGMCAASRNKDLQVAIKQANTLLALEEQDAETALLRCVAVVRTEDPLDQKAIPWRFEYRSTHETCAATGYWTMRLILIKLHLYLDSLDPPADGSPKRSSLEAEQERATVNILMSWQYAYARGDFFAARCFALGLLAVWGALTHRETLRRTPTADIRHWILMRFCNSMAGYDHGQGTLEDLEDASAVLAGGCNLRKLLLVPPSPLIAHLLALG